MKSIVSKIVLMAIFSILLSSCAKDDDGIYFNESIDIEAKASYSSLEKEILDLVNNHRNNIGLQPLSLLNVISSVADSHTEYMIKQGAVSHDNFPTRQEQLMNNATAKSVGENVAYGFNSASGVVSAWLKSDGHKRIIEKSAYTHFGISTETNKYGRNYFTLIFIEK